MQSRFNFTKQNYHEYKRPKIAPERSRKADILEMAKQMADDLGEGGMIQLVRSFHCLGNNGKPDYSEDEIAEAIYSGRGESSDVIRNAMAWFALEEVARELNPDI